MRPVDDQVRAHLDLPASASAIVKVSDKSPAAAAGLRPHDIILSVDGKTYTSTYEMGEVMGDKMPETSATLQVLRKGKKMDVTILPVERK